jgi:hypothetical protein
MNTGQMLLVIGALALLSTIALSVNRALLESELGSIDTEAAILAVSLGQARLDQTAAAGFDSIATGVSVDTVATPFAAFFCSTQVYYVAAAAPEDSVGGPTSLKRIRVTVVNDYMARSISLATIVGEY